MIHDFLIVHILIIFCSLLHFPFNATSEVLSLKKNVEQSTTANFYIPTSPGALLLRSETNATTPDVDNDLLFCIRW